jgi:hypothetical protein
MQIEVDIQVKEWGNNADWQRDVLHTRNTKRQPEEQTKNRIDYGKRTSDWVNAKSGDFHRSTGQIVLSTEIVVGISRSC